MTHADDQDKIYELLLTAYYGFAGQVRNGRICQNGILRTKPVIGIYKNGFKPKHGIVCYGNWQTI
jgi:hypothetical protein